MSDERKLSIPPEADENGKIKDNLKESND